MKLKTFFAIITIIAGLGLIGYSTYWYQFTHYDMSQFLAFAICGFLLVYLAIILFELVRLEKELGKFAQIIEYFISKPEKSKEEVWKKATNDVSASYKYVNQIKKGL